MALVETTYRVYTSDVDLEVEIDYTDLARKPLFISTHCDEEGRLGEWVTLKQAEEFRRDLGKAIRQVRELTA